MRLLLDKGGVDVNAPSQVVRVRAWRRTAMWAVARCGVGRICLVPSRSDSDNERPPRFFFVASLNPHVSTVADLKQSTVAGLK